MRGADRATDEAVGRAAQAVAEGLREGGRVLEVVREAHAAHRAESARGAARRADLARAGRLGPQVARVQAEVDAGRTTWAAVLDGTDRSPAAAAARGHVVERLARIGQAPVPRGAS